MSDEEEEFEPKEFVVQEVVEDVSPDLPDYENPVFGGGNQSSIREAKIEDDDLESFIAFIIHDSIVLDMKEGERHKIPELLKIFSDTDLGKFLVNVRAGFNFGEMKEINL